MHGEKMVVWGGRVGVKWCQQDVQDVQNVQDVQDVQNEQNEQNEQVAFTREANSTTPNVLPVFKNSSIKAFKEARTS